MSTNLIREFFESSQLAGGNADYVEQLYESWLADPSSVDATWSKYFETFKGRESGDVPHSAAIARIEAAQKQRRNGVVVAAGPMDDAHARKQAGVLRILTAYRSRGHLAANLDPLGLAEKLPAPDLEPAFHPQPATANTRRARGAPSRTDDDQPAPALHWLRMAR